MEYGGWIIFKEYGWDKERDHERDKYKKNRKRENEW